MLKNSTYSLTLTAYTLTSLTVGEHVEELAADHADDADPPGWSSGEG